MIESRGIPSTKDGIGCTANMGSKVSLTGTLTTPLQIFIYEWDHFSIFSTIFVPNWCKFQEMMM